jgi:tRNA modification GTPase
MNISDTICSLATPQGIGAIAMIRLSGENAFPVAANLFKKPSVFMEQQANFAKWAEIYDDNQLIDQIVVIKYGAPHSYTGEDMVEITCHGSKFIQQRILELLFKNGARMAEPGEFSMRAFLNGKMDLTQAEAVVDLIDSQTESSHKLAIHQLKGNFSKKIKTLRTQFVELAALLELELDFSEEDVEFADRSKILHLLSELKFEVTRLTESFKLGNVIKNGIPVAIIGKPNVGKSTLLNALLDDDRAIVSHIPGTTRDTIEDNFTINGVNFRLIDTAGIRITKDEIETIGIERTFKAIDKAEIILYMVDITDTTIEDIEQELLFLENEVDFIHKKFIIVANKIDKLEDLPSHFSQWNDYDVVYISARKDVNIEILKEMLNSHIAENNISEGTLLTNIRHYEIFLKIQENITKIEDGFAQKLPTDIIAIDINQILHDLGMVTGEITTNEVLNTIFGSFCIGK